MMMLLRAAPNRIFNELFLSNHHDLICSIQKPHDLIRSILTTIMISLSQSKQPSQISFVQFKKPSWSHSLNPNKHYYMYPSDLKLCFWSFAKIWPNLVIHFHLLIMGSNIFKRGSSDRLVFPPTREWYYFTQTHNTPFTFWPCFFLAAVSKIWCLTQFWSWRRFFDFLGANWKI